MTRSQFLGLLTLPLLTRFVKKDDNLYPTKGSGINGEVVKGDQWKISHDVRKYPLTTDECYWVTGLSAHPGNEVTDNLGNYFYVRSKDNDRVQLCVVLPNSDKIGNEFVVIKTAVSEGAV